MANYFKKLFTENLPKPKFSNEQYRKLFEIKKAGLERILGPMHEYVGHAIIPFAIGGAVDMYYFPHSSVDGTAFATMELVEPDGSGPKRSQMGPYELVAFTKHKVDNELNKEDFDKIERRMCGIFTILGGYSYTAVLNPLDTVEVPVHKDEPNRCLILDEYKKDGVKFMPCFRKSGLLLVIEVFREEMEYAMKNGSQAILTKLKEKGYYPYSDLDRDLVI